MITTTTKNSSSRSSSLLISNKGDMSDSTRSTVSTSTVSTVDSMESEGSIAVFNYSQKQEQEETPSCSSTTCRKSVRFSNVCTLRHTIHLNDYTAQEVEASFWSEDEMAFLNERTATIIRKMEGRRGGKQEQQHVMYCTRGLEKYASEERRRIFKARQGQYEAVMVVEELEICGTRLDAHGTVVTDVAGSSDQVVDGNGDYYYYYYADLLCKTCQHISSQSRLEARRRALQDEQYISNQRLF
eukprot:CAMPEP_0113473386 /NCGR_PEP_ID=MMETSP0014_2-20120614/18018_1 /TAXON_ID=2857 /ORGANISM="Nitzschia sp." /LENGTH=241 /DNA_ID=CAMNT_0000366153 /DNA_START=33 /DNA_END=758 /DNA_ORIENTATION=+ /assembly_acc=CAM_ASM_000159